MKNFEKSEIQIPLPRPLVHLANFLEKNGFIIYLVGGVPRDFVLNEVLHTEYPLKDFDLEVHFKNGHSHKIFPEILQSYSSDLKIKEMKYSVYRVKVHNVDCEFSLARYEKHIENNHSHSNFEIEIISDHDIQKSLLRRDFTANSILYRVSESRFRDPYDGINHIQNRILLSHNPNFEKDWLRFFRLIRFSVTKNLNPHFHLINEVNSIVFESINPFQFLEEFRKSKYKSEFCTLAVKLLNGNNTIDTYYIYFLKFYSKIQFDQENYGVLNCLLSQQVKNFPKGINYKKSLDKFYKKLAAVEFNYDHFIKKYNPDKNDMTKLGVFISYQNEVSKIISD